MFCASMEEHDSSNKAQAVRHNSAALCMNSARNGARTMYEQCIRGPAVPNTVYEEMAKQCINSVRGRTMYEHSTQRCPNNV